jgi:hypothetical protein
LQSNPVSSENKPVANQKYQDKAGTPGEPDTPSLKPKSSFSKLIKDRHKRAARMLGYVLTADNRPAWAAAALVWEARLDPAERYDLARSVMLAMRPEDNEALVADLLSGAGYPLPTFLDPLDDAQWWADTANPAELRAYALAAFMAMPQRDRLDFLEYVQGVTA